MPHPFFQVDAFADGPFTGNPAAVVVLAAAADDAWMQRVAAEMNLSETAFLVPRDDGFDLRWFTPAVEVNLCGHATLASAHALWEGGFLPAGDVARFHTRSGQLTAEPADSWIELNFPATPAEAADAPPGLLAALGVEARFVGKTRFDYVVEVAGEDLVRRLAPDFVSLRRLPVRGVMVTSVATTPGLDFVSRFFAPGSGIDEDPVTGSAHCALTPYWSGKLGRTSFVARQVSPRGGLLHLRLDGDRVTLRGRAVTIVRGELTA
jgi:predicted PhzF superfamily epimerase YddE/YHI9